MAEPAREAFRHAAQASSPLHDRARFDFLHGLRGLAALSVVLFHATLNARGSQSLWLRAVQAPLLHGYLAVPAFLVLSGFLLSVPVVTNGFALRGGLPGFMRRRAVRILPPYYAAYLLDMLFFTGAAWLGSAIGKDPGHAVRTQMGIGYQQPTVLAHLLLVHNLSHEWVQGMDPILWTIGCEWQIYLLFALVLVPAWRRAGTVAVLGVSGLLCATLTEASVRGWCCYFMPSMIPVFSIGMVAGVIVMGTGPHATAMRSWRWGRIVMAACVVTCAGVGLLDALVPDTPPRTNPVAYYVWSFRLRWIYDLLGALMTASVIVWLAVDARHGGWSATWARRVRAALESRPLFALGMFAYSLYLTHGIALVSVLRATTFLLSRPLLHDIVVTAAGVAVSLATGYCFYLGVERHCMSRETRSMFAPTNGRLLSVAPSAATVGRTDPD